MGEPAKFKTITIGGIHMLAAVVNGRVHYLHAQAPVGHCMRPGQRMKEQPIAGS